MVSSPECWSAHIAISDQKHKVSAALHAAHQPKVPTGKDRCQQSDRQNTRSDEHALVAGCNKPKLLRMIQRLVSPFCSSRKRRTPSSTSATGIRASICRIPAWPAFHDKYLGSLGSLGERPPFASQSLARGFAATNHVIPNRHTTPALWQVIFASSI